MFIDHFNDGSVGLRQYAGDGTITESGSQLRLYVPDGLAADVTLIGSGPVTAYVAGGIVSPNRINGPWSFDLKFDQYNNLSGNTIAGLWIWKGPIEDLWSSPYAYEFGYYPNESAVIISRWLGSWSGTRLATSGQTKPNGVAVKHIYRVFVNPFDKIVRIADVDFGQGTDTYMYANSIGFAFSVDAGVTWTWWHQRTLEFEVDGIGAYLRSWSPAGGVTHEALFDYFSIRTYDWEARTRVFVPSPSDYIDSVHDRDKRTFALLDDDVDLVIGGGGQTGFEIEEVDRGAWMPGPADKIGYIGDEKPPAAGMGMEDEVQLETLADKNWASALLPSSLQDKDQGGRPDAVGAEDEAEFQTQSGLVDNFWLPEAKEAFRFQDEASIGRQSVGAEDELYWELEEADYQDEKFDTDGKELLYNTGAYHALLVRTDVGSFGDPTANNHWGAARDGKLYADGVECGSLGYDFGTLVGGIKDSAWSVPGQLFSREPYYLTTPAWHSIALSADDELQEQVSAPPGNWIPETTSWDKWYVDGDFDVEIEVEIVSWNTSANRFEFGVGNSRGGTPGANIVYIVMQNDGTYAARRQVNGGYAQLGTVARAYLTARLRITRTSNVYQCYKWDAGDGGWVAVGTTYSHVDLEGPMYLWMGPWCQGGFSIDVKYRSFAINAGTVTNRVSWYREAHGLHRGLQSDMPNELAIISTTTSLELIDTSTDKLWMRFVRGSGVFIDNGGNSIIRDMAWKDGILLVAVGRNTAEAQEGNIIVIDFTMDMVRYHREAASTVCGSFYQGRWQHEPGHIVRRNSGYTWAGDYDTWHILDYRTRTVDAFHSGAYHYRAIGTVEGIQIFKWLRWNMNGIDANSDDWDMNYAAATEVTEMLRARFFSDGELIYIDATTIYSRSRSNGLDGWEDVIGSTWTAEYSKSLPGTRVLPSQYMIQLYEPGSKYVFMPANEGVYRVDWPSGSWELFYGPGGTHDILPAFDRIASISLGSDGVSDLLIIGMEQSGGSQIVAVRLSDNTVYGLSVPKAPTRAPKELAS